MTSAQELARMVDHTLLRPEAAREQVDALVEEAGRLGVYSVCVSPSFLPLHNMPADVKVCTVVGFPSGAHHVSTKAGEANRAITDGADEVDMVINLAHVKEGRFDLVEGDIRGVRQSVPRDKVLKVIIESAALTDEEIVGCCRAAEAANANFVKTSTGFHPTGGASAHAVSLMRQTVGDRLGVKASGGIRDAATALAMVEAGASRLGLSGTAAVLDGLCDPSAAPAGPAGSGH